jgi:antirestriction protein
MEGKKHELKKLFEAVEHKIEHIPSKVRAIEKLTKYLKGTEKPKRETLDRISLLVGFQDWESFKEALHGDSDGQMSYGEEKEESKNEEKR